MSEPTPMPVKRDAEPAAPIRSGSLSAALTNLRWLMSSRGLAGILSLFYVAIVTRTLGPAKFGQFALTTGIAQTVLSIVSFQTWQIIIRYGTRHLHEGRPERLARVIKAALLLDFVGALAGVALAGVAIIGLGPSFGWSADTQRKAFIFCLVVLIAIRSTPIGVLRLYDRFGAAAAGDAALPIVRLLGSLAVLAFGPSVTAFLIAWAVSEVASTVTYWILAMRVSRALPWRKGRLSRDALTNENPGIYRFALATNGGETISLATRQLPVLLVGYFASPVAAGNYRLAHQLGRAMAKMSQLFARSLLPELMRMHTTGSHNDFAALLGRIVRATAIGGGALLLLMALIGRQVLLLVSGPAYASAYPLLIILSAAAVIELVGVAFEPALIASGRAGLSFALRALGAAVMVALMVVLIPMMGTKGAAIAVVSGTVIAVGLLAVAVWKVLHGARQTELIPELIAEAPEAED